MIDYRFDWAWIAAYFGTPLASSTGITICIVAVIAWWVLRGKREAPLEVALFGVSEAALIFILLSAGITVWNAGDVTLNGRLVSLEQALCESHGGHVGYIAGRDDGGHEAQCERDGHVLGTVVVKGRRVIADLPGSR